MPPPKKDATSDLVGGYIKSVAVAQFDDPYIRTQCVKVFHMAEPPTRLLMPDVAARMMIWWLRQKLLPLQHRLTEQMHGKQIAAAPGNDAK